MARSLTYIVVHSRSDAVVPLFRPLCREIEESFPNLRRNLLSVHLTTEYFAEFRRHDRVSPNSHTDAPRELHLCLIFGKEVTLEEPS